MSGRVSEIADVMAQVWMGCPGGSGPGMRVCDAIVIGSGISGLVAAAELSRAGWDVVVLEANPMLGGAIRTAELACTLDQFLLWRPVPTRPGHQTPVDRLWHIGASTHPGPGLSGASGHIVASHLLKRSPLDRLRSLVG